MLPSALRASHARTGFFVYSKFSLLDSISGETNIWSTSSPGPWGWSKKFWSAVCHTPFNMAAATGGLLLRRNLSFFARSSALSLRQAIPARHNPSLKKKSKPAKDQKKKKAVKLIRKPTEIVPPTDPESLLNLTLLEPKRRRETLELSDEEKEKRVLLLKEWSRFKMQQHKEELQRLQQLTRCREEALKELKKTSIFLYQEAIKTDKQKLVSPSFQWANWNSTNTWIHRARYGRKMTLEIFLCEFIFCTAIVFWWTLVLREFVFVNFWPWKFGKCHHSTSISINHQKYIIQ